MKNNSRAPIKVSVIIPDYNAEIFLSKSVLSAVHLEEVEEIILIPDGSIACELKACKKRWKQTSRK